MLLTMVDINVSSSEGNMNACMSKNEILCWFIFGLGQQNIFFPRLLLFLYTNVLMYYAGVNHKIKHLINHFRSFSAAGK